MQSGFERRARRLLAIAPAPPAHWKLASTPRLLVAVVRSNDATAVEQLCCLAVQFCRTGQVSQVGTATVACLVAHLPLAPNVPLSTVSPPGLTGMVVPCRDESLTAVIHEWTGAPTETAPIVFRSDTDGAIQTVCGGARVDISRISQVTDGSLQWKLRVLVSCVDEDP
jgi:hypothetical protein